jgi:hypothetical protein
LGATVNPPRCAPLEANMSDRTLPAWLRLVLLVTGLMQFSFGLTVLLNPGAIDGLWPWPLSPISARLLGASSLVSVPLSILTAVVNRWSAARIPLVMLLAYRVLQVAVGVVHIGRFDFTRPITWNYFGGGLLLGLLLAYGLARGSAMGKPVDLWPGWLRGQASLRLGLLARAAILGFAGIYALIGLTLLILGQGGAWLWIEPAGAATSLTLRLFASPTFGLSLGLLLVTRARLWREVAIPAAGLSTIGLTGSLAILLELGGLAPATALGYFVALTPPILLMIGLFLFTPGRAAR